jgi:glucose-1-phosphatase
MIKVLLFDLGGVIVDFSGVRDISPFLLEGTSEAEINKRFAESPSLNSYLKGNINDIEFCELFVQEWGIQVLPKDFVEIFKGWSKCLFPGAIELLNDLRPRYRLAALSNSNKLHWERNTNELGVTKLFEVAISSHQVGICKPDTNIYNIALKMLDVTPCEVVFFDDIKENVDTAIRLGINSFQVNGISELRHCLYNEQIL